MNLKIKSSFSCLVNIENKEYELNNIFEYLKLKTTKKEITFKIYPIENEKKYLPYYVKISTTNIENNNSIYYKICKFSCQEYEIIFLPYSIEEDYNLLMQKKITLNKKDYNFNIYSNNEKCKITINSNKTIKTFLFEFRETIFINIKQSDKFVFIKLNNTNENYFVCFKVDEESIFLDEAIKVCQINFKKDIITIYGKIFDIIKHGIIIKYNLTNKTKSKKLVYTNKTSPLEIKTSLIPIVFCESLLIGNLKICRKYLSKTLSEKIDDTHLKKYFGDYTSIRYNYKEKTITLEYPTEKINLNKCVTYKFEFINNQINNIFQL